MLQNCNLKCILSTKSGKIADEFGWERKRYLNKWFVEIEMNDFSLILQGIHKVNAKALSLGSAAIGDFASKREYGKMMSFVESPNIHQCAT